MRLEEIPQDSQSGFVHVGEVLRDVLKEIIRRGELRERLKAERGGPISNQEFLEIADHSGGLEL